MGIALFERLGVDGRIILKWAIMKCNEATIGSI
jgi:hypothetical protein